MRSSEPYSRNPGTMANTQFTDYALVLYCWQTKALLCPLSDYVVAMSLFARDRSIINTHTALPCSARH